MTLLDWGILAFTAGLAAWGYAQGLIVGALTLGGFLSGAFLGSRLGPFLLAGGSSSPYAPLCAALGALLVGAFAALACEGLALGMRQRLRRRRGLHRADGAGGAALIASVALGLTWVLGAVALHAPSTRELRPDLQGSLILRSLNDLLPPSGPVLNAIARVDPAPGVAAAPEAIGPPEPAILADPDVLAAGRSVVRVRGTACGLGVEGSGWVAAPGLVVTNAHVVAGSKDTTVTTQDGAELEAVAVHYEPRNDLAVLAVTADLPPLEIATGVQAGAPVALLGYPEDGPYTAVAARLGETRVVLSEDSYGRGPRRREMVALRGVVRSGNSGGPLVDSAGRAQGAVFAASVRGRPGGYAVPAELVRRALASAAGPVQTGPCTA